MAATPRARGCLSGRVLPARLLHAPLARASALGVLVLLAACSLPWVGLWSGNGYADTGLYGLYGHRLLQGQLPYRDFYMEFPPGALPALALPDLAHAHYIVAFHAFQFLCLALGIVLVASILVRLGKSGWRLYTAAALAGFAPALLGPISLNAFDSWPALLTVAAIALGVSGHNTAAGSMLGASAAAKLFGVLALPIMLVHAGRTGGRRAVLRTAGGFCVVSVIAWGPFAAIAPGGLGYSVKTQAQRGLQIESLFGSALTVGHRLGVYEAHVTIGKPFSVDLAGSLAHALSIVSSIFVFVAVVTLWRRHFDGAPTMERLLTAVVGVVVAFMTFGRVFSPQYLLWLVPLVPLVEGIAAAVLFALALGLTLIWARFPEPFGEMTRLGPEDWAVLARNLTMIGLYVVLLRRLNSRASTT